MIDKIDNLYWFSLCFTVLKNTPKDTKRYILFIHQCCLFKIIYRMPPRDHHLVMNLLHDQKDLENVLGHVQSHTQDPAPGHILATTGKGDRTQGITSYFKIMNDSKLFAHLKTLHAITIFISGIVNLHLHVQSIWVYC